MQRGTAELTISPQSAFFASAETSGSSFIARLNYKIRHEHILIPIHIMKHLYKC